MGKKPIIEIQLLKKLPAGSKGISEIDKAVKKNNFDLIKIFFLFFIPINKFEKKDLTT